MTIMKMMNKRRKKKTPLKMKNSPELPSSVRAHFLPHPCASWPKEVPRRRSKTQGRAHGMKPLTHDSEVECEKVAPKKGTKKKKEVPKEEATNFDSEGEGEEVMTIESLLPKLNCVMKQTPQRT